MIWVVLFLLAFITTWTNILLSGQHVLNVWNTSHKLHELCRNMCTGGVNGLRMESCWDSLFRIYFADEKSFCARHRNKFVEGIYLSGVYIPFNTVQLISWWVVFLADETITNSWSSFCTVSNYQLSHIRSGVWTADLRGLRWVQPLCHCGPFDWG